MVLIPVFRGLKPALPWVGWSGFATGLVAVWPPFLKAWQGGLKRPKMTQIDLEAKAPLCSNSRNQLGLQGERMLNDEVKYARVLRAKGLVVLARTAFRVVVGSRCFCRRNLDF
ncbi:MAG: hypothetical protein A2508_04570 [Candidatus Lambdaproteobacteria bacterium RIFOXYD12_FULL_49_8]|uniref:Uncharacterized protein n=1 Tax=Candidatus Lambdaproteobacteria bacterium RIFOXYD2_FULL_50_16 TaxID=1817772 RepID=A0A1F6G4I4_9PROT|nr:MAG: hypothetical protein A2527_13870 [Candidatus Lambdaproteobacteria bacterium RIFOXYD2_FULL_50_16]OGG97243.1 MAG: hypothetical protein A2508_04570 [Candidatus Lambdaproteobacteria bacterium RIFOXYD12_FULL_49_8]